LRKINGIVLYLILLFASSCGERQQLVATVNSQKITQEAFNTLCQVKAQLLGVPSLSSEERRVVLDDMVKREIVILHATKNGIVATAEELDRAKKNPRNGGRPPKELERMIIHDKARRIIEGDSTATNDEIRKYYSSHKKEYTVPEAYRVYLVKVNEPEAAHILKQVSKNPESFDNMALETSPSDLKDVNRKAELTPKDQFPDEMVPLLQKMRIGEVAGPIKVKRGVFLFKLVDRRRAPVRPLVDVYAEIAHLLTAEKGEQVFEKWYAEAKGDYKVRVLSKELQ